MSLTPDTHQLARQLAILEKRMKTMQSECRTDIARLAEDMAKRDTRMLLFVAAIIGLGIAILGFIG